MAIRFILGRSGSGKSRQILQEIKRKCDQQPEGSPIVMLVPDQMSFHTEYQLLKQSEKPSLMRVQGLSFKRFAFRILQETGGLSRTHLDETGLALLVQKVINDQKDQLNVFSHYAGKPGFIKKVGEILAEFKSYCVEPGQLMEKLEGTPQNHLALPGKSQQKLQDLAKIFQAFSQLAHHRYLMSEDYYQLLREHIEQSPMVSESDFYVDGYHHFDKQEEEIILALMERAQSVTIVLTHDPDSSSPVFGLPARTLSRLQEGLRDRELAYTVEKREDLPRFERFNAIAYLEQNFLQYPKQPLPQGHLDGLAFFQAANRRLEVEETARRIHHLVHKQGAAYSDIAIYCGSMEAYDELFAAILPKYDIPFFLDLKVSMINHPLISLLYHVLDIFQYGWTHDSVFTTLKTGLFMDAGKFKQGADFYALYQAHLEDIDFLENYALARNVGYKHWHSSSPWTYERYLGLGREGARTEEDLAQERRLNELKAPIAQQLQDLEKDLKKASACHDFAVILFQFLEDLQVPDKLALFEEAAAGLEDLQQQKRHEQVWNRLLALFEQVDEIGGEEVMSLSDFSKFFKAGLEQLCYATVPPSLDQVQIGDIRRSRYQLTHDIRHPGQFGIRHGFVVGVNEGQVPPVPAESSLISENERVALKELGLELSPSLEQNQGDELFSLYSVFTSPKESLTLSCAISNDEGKEFLPSYIYGHVKKLFMDEKGFLAGQIREAAIGRDQGLDIYENLTTSQAAASSLIAGLGNNPDNRAYYQPLLDYFAAMESSVYDVALKITGFKNQAEPLAQDLVKAIYSEEITASVSRLEMFNRCAFAHFARYGLKLQERELYSLELPHIGELYHESLKLIAAKIQEAGRTFADLTDEECRTLAEDAAAQLGEKLLYQILKQNKRMEILAARLAAVVYKTLLGLKYQSQKSAFQPAYFEKAFDTHPKKDAIQLPPELLPNGFTLSLRGVIDRIDVAKEGGRAWMRVVDYKSSKKDLELDAVYYGLNLQLLTYLDVALNQSWQLLGENAQAGGLLYFHVHHPFLTKDEELLNQGGLESLIKGYHLESYKMSGYLPADYEVALMSDQDLAGTAASSDIVPITLKKDGSFAARGNQVLEESQLGLLRRYTRRKIVKSAEAITEGQVQIDPIKKGKSSACDFCPYRGICQFDPDFEGEAARFLPKMKPEAAFACMMEELEDHEKGEIVQ